ncbi:MAG: hypothetical protein HC929_10700 [Leptolyngbyaceae cyanobacterium SM2_5_2]|nr:hypothetical protein [Leptolyngbyaceae cyanobacterium SM2_5_2]
MKLVHLYQLIVKPPHFPFAPAMDANAFNAIQDKLRRQIEGLRQSDVDVPIDWPPTKGVRTHPVDARLSTQRADFQSTVETLRQRSSQTVVGAMENRRHRSPAMAERLPTLDPTLYQQCLQSLQAGTDMLNQLSLQQEQAIVEMQRVHAQLAYLEPVWLEQFGETLRYPHLLFKNVGCLVSADLG